MYFHNKEYTERDWRVDADARERAEEQRVRDHMQDYAMENWAACDACRALSDGTEPPSTLESQLKASIDHVNAQRAASQTKSAAEPGLTQVSAPDDRHLEEVYPVRAVPQVQPKSRTHALLSAAPELDDDDLEEIMLYAQFKRAQHRTKRKR